MSNKTYPTNFWYCTDQPVLKALQGALAHRRMTSTYPEAAGWLLLPRVALPDYLKLNLSRLLKAELPDSMSGLTVKMNSSGNIRVAGVLNMRRRTRGGRPLGRTGRAPGGLRLHRRRAVVHRGLVTLLQGRGVILRQKGAAVVDDRSQSDLRRRMGRVLLYHGRRHRAQHLAFDVAAAATAIARIVLGRGLVIIARRHGVVLGGGALLMAVKLDDRLRLGAQLYGDHVDLLILLLVFDHFPLARLHLGRLLVVHRPRIRFPLLRHQTARHRRPGFRHQRRHGRALDIRTTEREPVREISRRTVPDDDVSRAR